ncbi:hypothetical protein FSP39_007621 [Pinctada imbricata]|uniref:NR LBD domain-containing protein n=1 Tax=Pinctada imbricata TaxID=66713 RepID=A0AA89BM03_PINIB|nr:hypothetical protein FSP39_007621 [Pinctada imbricata]
MNKDAVQHERAPRCYQYKRESPDIFRDDKPIPILPHPIGDFMERNKYMYFGQFNRMGGHPSYSPVDYNINQSAPPYFPPLPIHLTEQKRNPFLTANITNGNIHIGLRHNNGDVGSSASSTNSSISSVDSGKTGSPSPTPSDADDSLDATDKSNANHSPKRQSIVKVEQESPQTNHDDVTSTVPAKTEDEHKDDIQQISSTPIPVISTGSGILGVTPPIYHPQPIMARQEDSNGFYLSRTSAENVYEIAAKLLFMSVKWARNIPSFLQLPFRDQAILLEESWCELFILSAAQWSLHVDAATLLNSNGYTMEPHIVEKTSLMAAQLRHLQDILARMATLRIDTTEYSCLKAIVLFKSGIKGIRDVLQVEALQDQSQVMLNEYTMSQSSNKARFGKLLLLLPDFRNVSARAVEEIFFRRTIGNIPIERLLCDMFKSS